MNKTLSQRKKKKTLIGLKKLYRSVFIRLNLIKKNPK